MQNEDTITAYKNAEPKKQEQSLPGSEKELEPFAGKLCLSLLLEIFMSTVGTDRRILVSGCIRAHQA